MSAQKCGVCRGTGHNARSTKCPRRKASEFVPDDGPDMLISCAPVIAAIRAHADAKCGICRGALDRAGDRPGRIRVFLDLCGEGQRLVRDTPFAGEARRTS